LSSEPIALHRVWISPLSKSARSITARMRAPRHSRGPQLGIPDGRAEGGHRHNAPRRKMHAGCHRKYYITNNLRTRIDFAKRTQCHWPASKLGGLSFDSDAGDSIVLGDQ